MHIEIDKPKLLERMQTEYHFVERTLLLIPDNWMIEPNAVGTWSAKDTVAHLAAWQRRTLRWITLARAGEGIARQHPAELEPGYGWDQIDALNDLTTERDKDRLLAEVLTDFRYTFHQLLAEVREATDDELFGRAGVSAFFRDPLWNYIAGNTYDHYERHIPALRQWLRDSAKFRTATGEIPAIRLD